MNILYIGPYRQVDYVGQLSKIHIDSIKKSLKSDDNLMTRALYLDYSLADNNKKTQNEDKKLDKIDIIIQYLPINFLAINKNYKNIAIPILDPKLNNITNDNSYKDLNFFDKILVDEEKHKNLLRGSSIKTPIEVYEEKINDNIPQRFSIDTIENSYKFGFIGQYSTNKQIVQKIICSFLISSRQIQQNTKLCLFLRGSDKEKEELDKLITDIKKQLNVPEYINKIITIFGMWETSEALTAINSIDCFLSINDDYRYYLYEKLFMTSYTDNVKFLINRQNTQTVETPIVSLNNIDEYKNTLSIISTQDLILKMSNAITTSSQKYKKTDYPSLGAIVCKQAL